MRAVSAANAEGIRKTYRRGRGGERFAAVDGIGFEMRKELETVPGETTDQLSALSAVNPDLRCQDDPPYGFIEYREAVTEAACVLHEGPYSTLREAYQAVYQWIEDSSFPSAGNPRESSIDGIWNKENPADRLTEVQVTIMRP